MASKKTLNAKNLEKLGAARLAELLIEISAGDTIAKRRLRLELAGAASYIELAREIRKRLTTIARARSFIDWEKRKAFVADLETQLGAIIDKVAKADAGEALDLLWRFMALANSVFERCDDDSGRIVAVFHGACDSMGQIAAAAKLDPKRLAEDAFRALCENDYGQYDGLIDALAPALGAQGLDHLKQLFTDFSKEDLSTPNEDDQEVIGWSSAGPIYADAYAERRRDSVVRMALTDIADAQGDVDAFAVQPRAKQHLQDIWMAETKRDAEKAFDFFLEAYGAKYDKAIACLAKDRDVLLAFYDFPAEHWKHIRTTNPIESTFATVRLRTTKTKGCLSRMTALTMVFKLCQSASKKWRRRDGSHHIADIIQGVKFKEGEKLTERAA